MSYHAAQFSSEEIIVSEKGLDSINRGLLYQFLKNGDILDSKVFDIF